MSAPKQTIGLTNFAGGFSKCPPNPDAIRSIVFTKCDNLAVVNGPSTEILIPLTSFYVPVGQAIRATFTVPGSTSSAMPYELYRLNLGGVDVDGEVKFIALLPDYGATAANNSLYLEWTSVRSIDEGLLFTSDPTGPTGNTNFEFFEVNDMEFSWGGYISYGNGGTGNIYAATNGGLLRWDGEQTILWNTLNSNSPTDYLSCLLVDSSDNVWVGSNAGVLVFNEKDSFSSFSKIYNITNANLGSNTINDLKLYSTNQLVAATDKGITVFNTGATSFSNYNIYNSPLLKHNLIQTLEVSSEPYIFAGTTGGVYVFNPVTNTWNTHPLNSSTVNGWTCPNDIQAIASYNGTLYVGTTGGMVVIPYVGMTGATAPLVGVTASVVVAGPTSSYSSNFRSLRIQSYEGNQLYVGHGDDGLSVYNIDNDDWWFRQGASGPVSSVLPDYLSGSSGSQTLYFSNSLGIKKYLTSSLDVTTVPDSATNTDLLLSVPIGSTTTGNFVMDTSRLYSSEQPMYFIFSKSMTGGLTSSSLQSFVTLREEADGSGATVTGTWSWDSTGKIGTFTPSTLEKAQGYNISIAIGGTAADNTYLTQGMNIGFYTENISPDNGWEPLGKMLVLSGADGKYIESIYLRNPHNTGVNVTALIGR